MQVAYIGKITDIQPIKDADFIESLTVVCGEGGKWRGTAQKGIFKVGDFCEAYLQDALLPKTERFAFMEKNDWRIRMRKFKGVPSECLIMPLAMHYTIEDEAKVGDVIPNIEKYQKPIPAKMAGLILGDFPSFIPKADEMNFQTVPEMIDQLKGNHYYVTVKCDGSSATFFKYNGHFGVCSRNLELKETEGNLLWKLAKDYKIIDNLPDGYAIQGEICGPSIQKNPMGLKEHDFFVFNVFEIVAHKYLDTVYFKEFVEHMRLRSVPFLTDPCFNQPFQFSSSHEDELRKLAEGCYENGKQREGIVIRPIQEMKTDKGERVSFKVINLLYKEA
ncbi:MAG: RNA ligase family protein [Nanoarchaeota archaeon]|nr:RNA ligase family protein [Nanoarchaeota archaeon]